MNSEFIIKIDYNNIIENESIKPVGINIKIDLNILIDKIIIKPNADDAILHRMKNITKEYNYNFEICPSKLSSNPYY